jgi:hypothetical protein
MPSFPKLQRNITYKNYLIDITLPFIIVIFNSTYTLVPLFIGLFITIKPRILFLISFLLFTEITHMFPIFSLIIMALINYKFIYPFLKGIIDYQYREYVSILIIYILYFAFLHAFFIMTSTPFNFNYIYIIYYIIIEFLIKRIIK